MLKIHQNVHMQHPQKKLDIPADLGPYREAIALSDGKYINAKVRVANIMCLSSQINKNNSSPKSLTCVQFLIVGVPKDMSLACFKSMFETNGESSLWTRLGFGISYQNSSARIKSEKISTTL